MEIEYTIKNSQVSKLRSYFALCTINKTSLVILKDDSLISLVDVETGKITKLCDCILTVDTSRKFSLEVVSEGNKVDIYTLEYTNKSK